MLRVLPSKWVMNYTDWSDRESQPASETLSRKKSSGHGSKEIAAVSTWRLADNLQKLGKIRQAIQTYVISIEEAKPLDEGGKEIAAGALCLGNV